MKIFQAIIVVAGSLLFFRPALAAEWVDPDNDNSQFAYSANLGWINAEPSGDGGPGLNIVGNSIQGWLWAANTGWISLSCENTSSCGTVEYGVGYDGAGNLSGYGWSPNLGWISFSCTDSSSCGSVDYSVSINTGSGEMAGTAYAANAGWISFSCTNTSSCGSVDFGIKVDLDLSGPELIFEDGFEGS